jgi:hypothetical protein
MTKLQVDIILVKSLTSGFGLVTSKLFPLQFIIPFSSVFSATKQIGNINDVYTTTHT